MYFTYIHIIVIVILLVIFGFFAYLVYQKQNEIKGLIYGLGGLLCGFALSSVIACVIIDDYTKKAKISNVRYTKVRMNESMQLSGTITNVGGFDITSCTLNVRLINSISKASLLKPELFEQKGGFWENFFKRKKQTQISTIEQDFTIAPNLLANTGRQFSITVRYPTTFNDPKINYKLSCH